MLEKDIEEPINYSSSNFAKDNVQSSNKDIKLESDSNFMMVIRFPNKKSFSLEIPKIWNTKKLLSFIMYTFKSEFNNSKLVFILKGNSLSPQSETPLKEILNSDKVNYMTISLKSNIQENQNNHDLNNLSLKTNKEVFNSEEFMEMEKNAIDDYIKIFKKNSVNTFPLMNPAYNHRREQINLNSELEKLAAFEPVPLEDFPRGKYFQLKIIFKCFISFFAFGIYIKGFNFILFLWVLIGYYWYCVNNVIDEFYNKKIQEIGITEEEYKRIKNEGINEYKGIGQGKELFIINDDNEDNEAKNKEENEQKKMGDKKSDNNINKTINELKNDIEEDLKDKEDDEKESNNVNSFVLSKEDDKNIEDKNEEKEKEKNINEATPLLNNINDIITGNNLRGRNDNYNNRINNANIFGENNRINNINNINNDIFGQNNNEDNRDDNKNQNENQEANRPESAIEIIYQIISVFFLSFIPVWCDEFEANNPISVNNNNHDDENNNENNDNNNINNVNNNENNVNNDNNFNNDNNNINNINNDYNNEINDNNYRPTSVEENDSNNNKMTSSRVVNMSDDSSRDTRVYKLIKKENQSANENEYVFSENGGIDNLSMNSELYKQKKEKEKEKDKEIEKQIFEEDEEYIIEEDKKNK